MLVHGAIVAALALRFFGGAPPGGEGGTRGAGDTVDVSLAASPAPSAPAPPKEETPPPKPQQIERGPTPKLPKIAVETPPQRPTNSGEDQATHSGRLAGPVALPSPLLGAGGDTVEGQRALLPHAIKCSDPVAGKWEALKFSPAQGDWVHFSLTVRRDAAGRLSGTILSHTWSGTAFDREPPPACMPGGFDLTVSMNASGRADASGAITFGSSAYSLVNVRCASLGNSYAPDNFSGTIDPARQEFQSVNNDGANDINAPYVFRRVGCLD